MLDKEQVIMAISASGLMALARWYVAAKDGKAFKPFFFAVDLFISMGMGYFAFMTASELGYASGMCSMASGVAGAIGSRAVDLIQVWIRQKVGTNDGAGNKKQ